MKQATKHRVEYGLVCFWGWIFSLLPYRGALAVGWGAAWLGHFVFRYRVALVHERIRQVFPQADARRVRQIAWRSWRNFAFNIVELFRIRKVDDAWMRRYLVNYESVRPVLARMAAEGRGGVGVSIHMGSVEISAVCLHQMGFQVFVIDGRQKNRLVEERIRAQRASSGITMLSSKDSSLLRLIFRRLREGGFLLLLADLRMRSGGVFVRFLEHTVSVAPGLGLFAKRSKVPVYPSIIVREGWTHHRLILSDPILPREDLDSQEDIQRMTQSVFDYFTQVVFEHPEQWFWYNKHWVLEPVMQEKSKQEKVGEEA